MRSRLLVAAIAVALGCGGEPAPSPDASGEDSVDAGSLALPPSAAAPRASLPGRSPDTLRPEARPPVPSGREDDRSRRLSPDELDVDEIVEAYRRFYRAEFYEQRSVVRDGVDPELVVHAKRRVALDWGYVSVGAWDALTRDMLPDQRSRLNTAIANVNRALAAELHGAEAP